MNDLLYARAQMEVSLAFHMVFAAMGIGMPLLLLIAEGLYLRTGQQHYRELAQRWSKVTAVLFVIGAVSGTALSFELGLLWPRFMAFAGSALGPAFALEGYAFFIEAIFVGLYLYGWDRLSARNHFLTGIPVALSGLASGVLVTAANAWMQCPRGVTVVDGRITSLSATAAFESPAWIPMAIHSALSCYVSVGFAVAGVAAWALLHKRSPTHHRAALSIALTVGALAAALQGASGDLIARMVAEYQPVKLAAMEAHYETAVEVPIVVGGVPDDDAGVVRHGLKIPYGLSLLARHDPHARIQGLRDFAREDWPRTTLVHLSFDAMVLLGSWLIGVGALYAWMRWRRRNPLEHEGFLKLLVVSGPLGFCALEAGWMVTEAGRQPWTVQGLLRTRDAVTPAHGVLGTLVVFTAIYAMLGAVVVVLLRRLSRTPFEASEGHR